MHYCMSAGALDLIRSLGDGLRGACEKRLASRASHYCHVSVEDLTFIIIGDRGTAISLKQDVISTCTSIAYELQYPPPYRVGGQIHTHVLADMARCNYYYCGSSVRCSRRRIMPFSTTPKSLRPNS